MKIGAVQKRLLAVVKPLAAEKRHDLEVLKLGSSGLKRTDFIWHYLLQSFATMGRASGANGLISNRENYQRVKYEELAALTPKKREKQVNQVCLFAKVRMPKQKARYILRCFEQVRDLGGPEKTKRLLLAEPGRDSKIAFLREFHGIGRKYSRNIMMDVYHEDFRDSIAIDVRIKSISEMLGVSFTDAEYIQHEGFYVDVAHLAGLNGWELDRLLFNFHKEVKQRLNPADKSCQSDKHPRKTCIGKAMNYCKR
jgi:hypothetical protein